MDDLLRLVNAAACIVTNTRKFDRGLTHAQRHDLHWLDASDHITNRLFFCVSTCTSVYPAWHSQCLSELCLPVAVVPGCQHLHSARRGQLVS